MRKSLQLGEVLPLALMLLFSRVASFLHFKPLGRFRDLASISRAALRSVNFLLFTFERLSDELEATHCQYGDSSVPRLTTLPFR